MQTRFTSGNNHVDVEQVLEHHVLSSATAKRSRILTGAHFVAKMACITYHPLRKNKLQS
jgi:hypothetical protein